MIAIAMGKKGSGKSAVIRKLASRALAAEGARRAILYHDPQCQISTEAGRVYESVQQWRADPRPSYLSIFRGVAVDEVGELALRVRDVTVVIDEMDRACNNKRWTSPAIQRIVHEGRHYRTSLLGTFRRAANVSEDLLSQVDYAFLFRVSASSPWDLQTIRHRFGEAYANRVQTLQMGEFVVWRDD